MLLSHEHVESKIPAKIQIYILTRAEILITLCYEIPCTYLPLKSAKDFHFSTKIFHSYACEEWKFENIKILVTEAVQSIGFCLCTPCSTEKDVSAEQTEIKSK